jgi:hypothetical protein
MSLVPQNINEAIKHLKPRSEEELAKLPKSQGIKHDTSHNFEVYENIISRKPYIKAIVEDILSASPKYSIQGNSVKEIDYAKKKENKEEEFEKFFTPTNSHIWKVATGTTIVSAGVGFYRGFCDAKGISLPQGELEQFLLKFGPMVAGTISGMGAFGVYGIREAKRIPSFAGIPYPSDIDFILGILMGGGIGAAAGGIGTLVGYGLGQLVGKLIDFAH